MNRNKKKLTEYFFPEDSYKPTLLGAVVILTGVIFALIVTGSLGIYGITSMIKAFSEEGFIIMKFVEGVICTSIAGGVVFGTIVWLED